MNDQAVPSPVVSGRPAPPLGRARRIVGGLVLAFLTMAALVHPLAALLSRRSWLAELISHFQHLGLLMTLTALGVALRRARRRALVLGALALAQAFPLFRFSGPNPVPPDPSSTDRVRLLMANLLVENSNHDALVRLIRRERPDIVGLVEFSNEWREGLEEVRRDYPYRVEVPLGARGLALWFREPPRKIHPPETPGALCWPLLHAEIDFAGRPRHLWLVHPRSPFIRRGYPEHAALADRIWSFGGSRVVMGDLNLSEGSPLFGDFLRDTALRDTRLGFGRQPTWPADWPYRIAIDHAFVSADLAVADRRLGPEIGSDHFPLIFDLAPARSAESSGSKPPSQAK